MSKRESLPLGKGLLTVSFFSTYKCMPVKSGFYAYPIRIALASDFDFTGMEWTLLASKFTID